MQVAIFTSFAISFCIYIIPLFIDVEYVFCVPQHACDTVVLLMCCRASKVIQPSLLACIQVTEQRQYDRYGGEELRAMGPGFLLA